LPTVDAVLLQQHRLALEAEEGVLDLVAALVVLVGELVVAVAVHHRLAVGAEEGLLDHPAAGPVSGGAAGAAERPAHDGLAVQAEEGVLDLVAALVDAPRLPGVAVLNHHRLAVGAEEPLPDLVAAPVEVVGLAGAAVQPADDRLAVGAEERVLD